MIFVESIIKESSKKTVVVGDHVYLFDAGQHLVDAVGLDVAAVPDGDH